MQRALLGDKEQLVQNLGKLISRVKGTKKLTGIEEIFVPGERGAKLTNEYLKSGQLEIEDNLLEELKKAAA